MVAKSRGPIIDVPNVTSEGLVPYLSRFPEWAIPRSLGKPADPQNPFDRAPQRGAPQQSPPLQLPPAIPAWPPSPSGPGYPKIPPELLYPAPGNDSPGFPSVPVTPPVQGPSPSPSIPGGRLDGALLAHLLKNVQNRRDVTEKRYLKESHASANGPGEDVPNRLTSSSSDGGLDGAQRSLGIVSNKPMQFWPVQPPIFFPFR
jgi:hypothetical protein